MSDDDYRFGQNIVYICIFVLFIALALTKGCSSDSTARRVLDDAGYTKIETHGYAFSCGKGDNQCTSFSATGPTGRHVTGAVGCGWMLKGCTIRIDY